MSEQVSLTQPLEEEPPQVKTLKSALKTFLETAWHGIKSEKCNTCQNICFVKGFYYGFMPEVARHRRSVGEEVSEHENYFHLFNNLPVHCSDYS